MQVGVVRFGAVKCSLGQWSWFRCIKLQLGGVQLGVVMFSAVMCGALRCSAVRCR